MRLCDFTGVHAEIVRFDLSDQDSHRLKRMGVFIGQAVEIRKTGHNFILTAAGGRLAVDQEIAQGIMVQVSDQQVA